MRASLFLNEASQVYGLVSEAETNAIQTRTLLLGDSVCEQFYGQNKSENIYCFCLNQSYEIPGNYLLLKSFLDNRSNFENVVLVINPITLASSLNQNYTYNYFVKPFRNHLKFLNSEDVHYLAKTFPSDGMFKYKFSRFEFPNAVDMRLDTGVSSLDISQSNLKYLRKMDSLCQAKKISFKMICPPLPSNSKSQIDKFTTETKELLPSYFESIEYYDSIYSKDGIHHKNAPLFIEKNKDKLNDLIEF